MTKINNIRGDLTDISAKKEALHCSEFYCSRYIGHPKSSPRKLVIYIMKIVFFGSKYTENIRSNFETKIHGGHCNNFCFSWSIGRVTRTTKHNHYDKKYRIKASEWKNYLIVNKKITEQWRFVKRFIRLVTLKIVYSLHVCAVCFCVDSSGHQNLSLNCKILCLSLSYLLNVNIPYSTYLVYHMIVASPGHTITQPTRDASTEWIIFPDLSDL